MSIPEQDWQAAVEAIARAEVAVISCHVHPDGDALGSALALHRALANAGRDAVVSFSEPFVVARHYRFLAGLDRLVPPAKDRTDGVVSGLLLALERDGVLEVDDDGVGA